MRKGFTLVEVVVALTLFGFVGLAGGGLLEAAARSTREAELRERVLWAATTVLDSLRARETWSSGEREVPGGHRLRWRPGEAGGVLEIWLRDGTDPWLVAPVGVGPTGEVLGS